METEGASSWILTSCQTYRGHLVTVRLKANQGPEEQEKLETTFNTQWWVCEVLRQKEGGGEEVR